MMKTSRARHSPQVYLRAAVVTLLCSSFLSCIGATPLPKRTRTPQGVEEKVVDLSFIHPGQTNRAEVKDKLKLIDTGYAGERFFLGRWSSSSWGYWYLLAGYISAAGSAGRNWKSGNLVVEFDAAGIVRNYQPVADKDLIAALAPVAADSPPAAGPMELAVEYYRSGYAHTPAKIVLAADSLNFEELGKRKKPYKFKVPAANLLRITTFSTPDPTYTMPTLYFAGNLKQFGGPQR